MPASSLSVAAPSGSALASRRQALQSRYRRVRGFSEAIAEPLEPEDCVLQSMPAASPIRWHLAHTTWFFSQFLLQAHADYRSPFPQAEALFNSYYNTVGEPFPQARRGLLSRPTVAEVGDYRKAIDQAVLEYLEAAPTAAALDVLEIGLHHEQQHQELMLTDIKHAFSCNPLAPALMSAGAGETTAPAPQQWVEFAEGLHEIGHRREGFAYDNESPSHRVFIEAFALASRPVSVGEYLAFIEDGGYTRPELWLSLGWQQCQDEGWTAPLYWQTDGAGWREFTLGGMESLDPCRPVTHVSYFEADAFARWARARLPTEAEWERAARAANAFASEAEAPLAGPFADPLWEEGSVIRPRFADTERAAASPGGLQQLAGNVWEWTQSSYAPYPGYQPPPGALGEYNGKFMCNQYVLRGGSCATPRDHVRVSYRNFFGPETRWQFSGIRLAR